MVGLALSVVSSEQMVAKAAPSVADRPQAARAKWWPYTDVGPAGRAEME